MKPQEERILEYLQGGGELTSLEALNLFGCFRLASRISSLKQQGHNILSETITLENGKRVSKYFMVDEPIADELSEAVSQNNLAQEYKINTREVNKQLVLAI